ncbi:hypothetical protein [Streptomyces rhizosphaericus]|uniref:APC family permease n=1 Tax=Streptomyces rhizosphaericus TaxID=114699 RepID=A0A6G4AV99_9ACTN|nr:hypothetical protein [Streptomyces rhizosphaericus]NEW76481.1 hypothetical protein [Streptomyces rhizosphaericus]
MIVVSAGSAWVVIARLGPQYALTVAQGSDAGRLIPRTAEANVGARLGVTFNAVILTSLVAVFTTTAQYTRRMVHNLAPATRLARTHPRHGSPTNAGLLLAALMAATLVGCRLAGLDPYAELAALLGVLGAVGIFGLEIACAAAIFISFRRMRDGRIWTAVLSQLIACLALAVCLVLVLANYAGLTGAPNPFAIFSPLLFVAVAVGGWLADGRQAHSGSEPTVPGPPGRPTPTTQDKKEVSDVQ